MPEGLPKKLDHLIDLDFRRGMRDLGHLLAQLVASGPGARASTSWMVNTMVTMAKTKMPEIHPRRAPLATESFAPVRRRYR